MKAMKSFVRTCYSEALLAAAPGEGEADAEKHAESSFVIEDGMGGVAAGTEQKAEEQKFHGGLGLKFKFPGDPKKYVLRVSSEGIHPECFDCIGCARRQRLGCGRYICVVCYSGYSPYLSETHGYSQLTAAISPSYATHNSRVLSK